MPEQTAIARNIWLRHVRDQKAMEAQIASALRTAAKEADRTIKQMEYLDGVGASVRKSQYQISATALRQLEADLWGKVDTITNNGIERSATLAVRGQQVIDSVLARAIGNTELRSSFMAAALNSANNIKSRVVNSIQLSKLVYRNQALSNQTVDRVVNNGIALNRSAREIANDIRRYIRPDVPGGVSYAAMRLGRTELNNAFHETTRRIGASHPWVEGWRWQLSGSHPHPDICNEYAEQDHTGLGAGIFPSDNVPIKPHPQCLCYIIADTLSQDDFIDRLVGGEFDDWMDNQLENRGLGGPGTPGPQRPSAIRKRAPSVKPLSFTQNDIARAFVSHQWDHQGLDDKTVTILDKWTGLGSNNKAERESMKKVIDDYGAPAPTLYRGMGVELDVFNELTGVTGTIDLPASSFTADLGTARGFAEVGPYEVIIHVQKGAKALDVRGPAAANGFNEQEYVTHGKFYLNSLPKKEGTNRLHLYLERQT